MRTFFKYLLAGWAAGLFCLVPFNVGYAAQDSPRNPEVTFLGAPVQEAIVDGDAGKFRAHHWIQDNYTGGIQDSSLNYKLPDGASLAMEGHGLIESGDYGGKFSLTKEKLGFLNIDYDQFRKYYDNVGGLYHRFSTLTFKEIDKDLSLDIGRLKVEAGLTLENLPRLIFYYERSFKEGTKSRLTWTPIKEGATTRNIGPSWQELHEAVDTFAVEADHTVAGISLNGEQKWELWHAKEKREEQSFSTTSVASDKKIRDQEQRPESNLITTTLKAQKSFLEDKISTSGGYRFAHMTNHEIENIFEYNQDRVLTSFTNPKQVRDAQAHNVYDSHTWVGSLMYSPWKSLALIPKFKWEIFRRQNDSAYPRDTTLPVDGIINNTEESNNDTKLARWGESISLRFTGIPRTAIYNDLEFEQARNWLSEDRQSLAGQSIPDTNEIFSRETITYVQREVWTLGAHVAPFRKVDFTSQVRVRRNNNDYDDQRETAPGASTARSAFVDWQNVHTNEFSTRVTFRPWKWLQPALRYQLRDDNYYSRFEDDTSSVKTETVSNIYTFDTMWQPRPDFMTMVSFSRQTALTETPARYSLMPAFQANVHSWLFETSYAPKPEIILTTALLYSRADNFNDFSDIGLPLGVDNSRLDLDFGIKYLLNKFTTIEPKYAFYHYRANPNAEFGNYNAHVISVEVSLTWM